MAGYNSIQILRSPDLSQSSNKTTIPIDGQPLYDQATGKLFIGDGTTTAENLSAVVAHGINSLSGSSRQTNIIGSGVDIDAQSGTINATGSDINLYGSTGVTIHSYSSPTRFESGVVEINGSFWQNNGSTTINSSYVYVNASSCININANSDAYIYLDGSGVVIPYINISAPIINITGSTHISDLLDVNGSATFSDGQTCASLNSTDITLNGSSNIALNSSGKINLISTGSTNINSGSELNIISQSINVTNRLNISMHAGANIILNSPEVRLDTYYGGTGGIYVALNGTGIELNTRSSSIASNVNINARNNVIITAQGYASLHGNNHTTISSSDGYVLLSSNYAQMQLSNDVKFNNSTSTTSVNLPLTKSGTIALKSDIPLNCTDYFAPTHSGAKGQICVSRGPGNTPTWETLNIPESVSTVRLVWNCKPGNSYTVGIKNYPFVLFRWFASSGSDTYSAVNMIPSSYFIGTHVTEATRMIMTTQTDTGYIGFYYNNREGMLVITEGQGELSVEGVRFTLT